MKTFVYAAGAAAEEAGAEAALSVDGAAAEEAGAEAALSADGAAAAVKALTSPAVKRGSSIAAVRLRTHALFSNTNSHTSFIIAVVLAVLSSGRV